MADTAFDVKKVAELARLKLNDQEEVYLQEQFKKIMDYIDIISEVEIDSEMEAKDESMQQIFREDVAIPSDVKPEDFSPYIENEHFKVPSVID